MGKKGQSNKVRCWFIRAILTPNSMWSCRDKSRRSSDSAAIGRNYVGTVQPGMFTGEIAMLTGRQGLVELRVTASGEVIEVDRLELLTLVQTDSEFSDILMSAFILRRVNLIEHQYGDAVLLRFK